KLHYRAVSGYATDDVEYSYRVKGLIDEWTTPGSQPEFTLADPEPGSYTIEARALNARGQYSDTVQTELHMALSPWQTVYFHIFISVITLIAGSLAGYHIYRYNNRRKEEKISLTREYYRLQMGRFVQQFDPHFAFNVISSIVAFIEVDDKEKANEYIVMFSNLLRKVIDRDDFAHSLDDEISFIKEYCEMQKLQMGDKLDYNLDIRNPESLVICVPRMMIHNFVENSIKWGIRHRKEGGRIDISVDSDSKNHVITVSDNGIGREAAKKLRTSSTGKGYNVTMNLVKILNRFNSKQMSVEINDLYDNDGKAAGTKVVVKVPAGFSMLNEAAERRCD
ncbi:MAG TPA: histidine kinase, partial [Bacteroidales bacterium]|nr:histidine kinase [Bacteroidales bacterium]